MIDLLAMKEKLDVHVSKRDRLLGQKEQLMEKLLEKGYKSIEEAEIALQKLDKKINLIEEDYLDNVNDFTEKYADLLK